jgi:hypothetical protein
MTGRKNKTAWEMNCVIHTSRNLTAGIKASSTSMGEFSKQWQHDSQLHSLLYKTIL